MIPVEALRPNERLCDQCEGGQVDAFDSKGNWCGYVPCTACDGTRVLVTENRESQRNPDEKPWSDLERILTKDRNEWRAKAGHLAIDLATQRRVSEALYDDRERLIGENRRMREVVDRKAKQIEQRMRAPSPRAESPTTCPAEGDGAHPSENVQ